MQIFRIIRTRLKKNFYRGLIRTGLIVAGLLATGCSYLPGGLGSSRPPPQPAQASAEEIAALEKRIKEFNLDVQALSSKMAEMDRKFRILSDEVSQVSVAKFEELENKLTILSEELRYLENAMAAGRGNRKAKLGGTFAAGKTRSGGGPFNEAEARLYKQATDYFYARNYPKAIHTFEEVASQFPKGTFADNAVFWVGECHFSMGNYSKAVSAYKKTFQYLNTEKADDAQFKIATAYQRMGEKKQAVIEFNKLLSLYPDSEYAGRTSKELSKLK